MAWGGGGELEGEKILAEPLSLVTAAATSVWESRPPRKSLLPSVLKLSVLPIRHSYWGTDLGEPHSLAAKRPGKCGPVTVRVCTVNLWLK